MEDIILLSLLIFAAGLLYSTVGHAGASGYLAAMALFGLAPQVMKPGALLLNILVAGIATAQFYRVSGFSWSIFWPFAMSSIPFAFLGGAVSLPATIYKQVLGIVLLFTAYRLFQYRESTFKNKAQPVPLPAAILLGAGIGFVSGSIGVGGGIFLSPMLLFMGWAGAKQTAGITAAFILVNSIAGISGHIASVKFLPEEIYSMALAAVIGGIIGSHLGSRRLANTAFYRVLSLVLVIAAFKLILV